MYSNSLTTIDDAREVVRRYGIDQGDLGGGSVDGFTAFLFFPGLELRDVEDLASRLEKYMEEVDEHAQRGASLDQYLIAEASAPMLSDGLMSRAEQRAEVADYIQRVKQQPKGDAIWLTVAELATTPAHMRERAYLSTQASKDEVEEALAGLTDLLPLMEDSSALTYVCTRRASCS